MSAPTHTSGPWRAGRAAGSIVAGDIAASDDAHSERGYYGGELIAESISASDRPLIIASPDLYDQLTFAVKLLDSLPGFRGTAQLDRMHAALAKARGEA